MQLAPKNECTGCTACALSCPQRCLYMKNDEFGFIYPILENPQKCIDCRRCERVCPVLNEKNKKQENTEAYAAFAKDETIRLESSSGGMFTLLADSILKAGGAVFGAAYNEDFGIQHICVEDEGNLNRLRGAKYAQSDLNGCFLDIKSRLLQKQQVLFSGTPCQVAGLKTFLQKEYANLFTIDFVCHGVPSPLVWEKYVQYRSDEDNAGVLPEKINLRDKKTGWSRYQYSNVYNYQEGNTYSVLNSDDLFMKLFVGDYINRTSCSDCHFKGYSRVSDITLGDFWGIWDILPDMDDNKGTSLVLVHSESGRQMMHKISDKIKAKEVTLQQASEQNPSLLISSAGKSNRNLILQKCINGQFDEVQQILSEQQNQSNQKKYIKVLRKLYHKLRNE